MTQPDGFIKLFVYGTLKRGERNHPVLINSNYLKPASTSPNYQLFDLGPYPGMIETPQSGLSILGEFFEIHSNLISELDAIEGAPTLFELNPITLNDGTLAFSYLYKRDTSDARLITTCNWQSIY